MRRPVRQSEPFEGGHAGRLRLLRRHAVELEWQGHVLHRTQARQQVVVLEHVADRPAPHSGLVVARHPRQGRAAHQDFTLGRLLETAGDGQQGALARAARPHDRHQGPGIDREVDAHQRMDLGRTLAECLGHTV